ncbi:glycosyltransferase family 2 protein [Antrihabitans sp. YC2-6]|uniref:glycosyltransferase family 2 protein n=1 Tax=Antrihabitans sp. YC2-6 TaxID=2799498 RepID=UPI0018F4A108|nr:glycosyltransferase family 2 protein [Antrihabitans sp. YC2-6]MBJ8347549.1 glycosyltransferase family 2 protein [Antrihabitans sp. YC2-6]
MAKHTLSVVIPAFNEEDYIGPCLEALVSQVDELHEIIVVDNNSTDSTAAIVREFAKEQPKIQLLSEPEPGVAFARNRGFDAATGDILGRLDSDSRAYPNWASVVLGFFERDDVDHVGGISGLNNSYDSPFRKMKGWWVARQVRLGAMGGDREIRNLHGANMAIRRSVWEQVRDDVSTRKDIHEDVDLALCINAEGPKILQLTDMRVDISPRRALTPPRDFTAYIDSGTKTFTLHGAMTPQIEKALRYHKYFHVLLYVLHRPYDPKRGKFSVAHAIRRSRVRKLPVTADNI